MSQCQHGVLKLQNLAEYQTYHMNLANLSNWVLFKRRGLNILVVCLTFKISSKVLKEKNRKITLVNSHYLAVIKQ